MYVLKISKITKICRFILALACKFRFSKTVCRLPNERCSCQREPGSYQMPYLLTIRQDLKVSLKGVQI